MTEQEAREALIDFNSFIAPDQNGLRTFGSDGLSQAIDVAIATLSPLPHQDGASAEEESFGTFIGRTSKALTGIDLSETKVQSAEDAQSYIIRTMHYISNEDFVVKNDRTPLTFYSHVVTKLMSGFAQSEVEKAVAGKDREIAELKDSGWVSIYDRLPTKEGIYDVKKRYSDDAAKGEWTGNCFTNYDGYAVTHWRENNPFIKELQSELSAANERIKELEDVVAQKEVALIGYRELTEGML